MFKFTMRHAARAGMAGLLTMATGLTFAQITPKPPPPRQDTPRSNTTNPEDDSRAGGALSQETGPAREVDAAIDADGELAPNDRILGDPAAREAAGRPGTTGVPEGTAITTILGSATEVGSESITVKWRPPEEDGATERRYRITPDTEVIVDGEPAELSAIPEGSTVRVFTLTGDPEVVTRLLVATPVANRPSAREADARTNDRIRSAGDIGEVTDSEDANFGFDVYPDTDSAPTPQRQPEGRAARRAFGGEEAVLSLGIEVYGHGPSGALVTEMLATSPAADAGMLIGDLLIAVNNQLIPDPELIEQLMVRPDRTVPIELTVLRNGQPLQLSVLPWELVDGGLVTPEAIRQAYSVHGVAGFRGVGGTAVPGGVAPGAVAPAGVVGAASLPFGVTGLTNFDDGGVAIEGTTDGLLGGLQPNDVVVGVNGQPVRDRAALMNALRSLPGNAEALSLDVMRDGRRTTLDVPAQALGENFRRGMQNPGAAQPGATQPGTTQPRTGQPGTVQPDVVQPGAAGSGARGGGANGLPNRSGTTPAGGGQQQTPGAGQNNTVDPTPDDTPGGTAPGLQSGGTAPSNTGGQSQPATGGTGTPQ